MTNLINLINSIPSFSVEFYVVMAVIAAAIVVLAARPRSRGEVQEYLLASRLMCTDNVLQPQEPAIEFRCADDGHVLLVRYGITGITTSGAVSAAVKFDGVDLRIEERLVDGSQWDPPIDCAEMDIDFLPPGRYHVMYNSQKTGLFVAFQLHVRPGLVATRILSR